MAMSDYCLCEVCGMKTFYDANLNYEPSDKAREDGGCSLERTAAMAAICKDCWTKGYRLKVVSIEDDDEIAKLRADLANAGAVMVEACAQANEKRGSVFGRDAAAVCRALSTLSPIAAAARVLIPVFEDKHRDYMTAKGRNPADYSSSYSMAVQVIRPLAEQEKADG